MFLQLWRVLSLLLDSASLGTLRESEKTTRFGEHLKTLPSLLKNNEYVNTIYKTVSQSWLVCLKLSHRGLGQGYKSQGL